MGLITKEGDPEQTVKGSVYKNVGSPKDNPWVPTETTIYVKGVPDGESFQ